MQVFHLLAGGLVKVADQEAQRSYAADTHGVALIAWSDCSVQGVEYRRDLAMGSAPV